MKPAEQPWEMRAPPGGATPEPRRTAAMKQRTRLFGLAAAAVLVAAAAWFTATGGTAYLYALHLESQWRKAAPKTRADLEKHLHGYSLREIQPKDSIWGRGHELQPGERMMQYRILWNQNCPLDVVYDSDGHVRAIYTSYE